MLPGAGLLPLVKVINRHKAAATLERRPVLDPLGLGVDVRETNFDVLGPVRNKPPARRVQATLARSLIEANDRQLVGGCSVPTRREVRGRSVRRDREGQLDLADIGGESDTATHGAKDGVADRRGPKRHESR